MMRLALFKLTAIVIACAGWAALQCKAQETHVAQERAPSRRSPDRVTELIRREAVARIQVQEKVFQRLELLPPGPPVVRVRPLQVQPAGRAVRFARPGVPIILEVVDDPDAQETDENAPTRKRRVAQVCFDLLVYGNGLNAGLARARCENILAHLIDQIDRTQSLSPMQRNKLLLAGHRDMKRLFDLAEDQRKTFESLRTDADRCAEFLVSLRPLFPRLRGNPLGAGSLFSKTLRKIVNEDKRMKAAENALAPLWGDFPAVGGARRGYTGRYPVGGGWESVRTADATKNTGRALTIKNDGREARSGLTQELVDGDRDRETEDARCRSS
ncbi:MAG: hypothetical protein ACP5XB_05990 [Isosphaeraceae bacterium]